MVDWIQIGDSDKCRLFLYTRGFDITKIGEMPIDFPQPLLVDNIVKATHDAIKRQHPELDASDFYLLDAFLGSSLTEDKGLRMLTYKLRNKTETNIIKRGGMIENFDTDWEKDLGYAVKKDNAVLIQQCADRVRKSGQLKVSADYNIKHYNSDMKRDVMLICDTSEDFYIEYADDSMFSVIPLWLGEAFMMSTNIVEMRVRGREVEGYWAIKSEIMEVGRIEMIRKNREMLGGFDG